MPIKPREQFNPSSVIELKAGTFTLPVLRLLRNQPADICKQLAAKVEQAPEMFRNAPLAIDIGAIAETTGTIEFKGLVDDIANLGIRTIGIRGGTDNQQNAARAAGLAVLAESRSEIKTPKAVVEPVKQTPVDPPPSNTEAPSEPVTTGSKLVTQPVRSGQRIYAENGDLIILASVSAGAEIMADGNIHIYGSMRGRALAGVKGNLQTRIFCSDLQAELVSISGQYQISEGIDESLQGKPVQIYLAADSLVIEQL